jgi:hypothetical protein
MIEAVRSLDRLKAAGMLARAALSVGYEGATFENTVVEHENEILAKIIAEVRARLAVAAGDDRPETFEQIADVLDQESDALLSPPDTDAALVRLAQRGDLPSDLYEINIIPNVERVYGKGFSLEKKIIETTIRAPTLEQHYGPPRDLHEPAMLSLFVRPFTTKWPIKNFFVVVAGQRDGFKLYIHQAWRIYPWKVSLRGVKEPVDYLRRFAEHYGAEMEIEGTKGHFFLLTGGPVPNKVTIPQFKSNDEEVMISRFVQHDQITGVEKSALVVGINVRKYQRTLDELGVRRKDIIDHFVPAPSVNVQTPSTTAAARRRADPL